MSIRVHAVWFARERAHEVWRGNQVDQVYVRAVGWQVRQHNADLRGPPPRNAQAVRSTRLILAAAERSQYVTRYDCSKVV